MHRIWTKEDVEALLRATGEEAGRPCDHVPVVISTKMTRTMGSFWFKEEKGAIVPHSFRFSTRLLSGEYPEGVVENVIKHEYAHFHVNVGTGVNQLHNARFKAMCRRLGIPEETYFKEILAREQKGYLLECTGCGKVVAARRRKDAVDRLLTNKVSRCCRARIRSREGTF